MQTFTGPRVAISYVPAAVLVKSQLGAALGDSVYRDAGGLIALDTASLRPIVVASGTSGTVELLPDRTIYSLNRPRFATVTTYQGHRFHPETIRAIAGDSAVLAAGARAILAAASQLGSQLILDFQGMTPNDLPAAAEMVRAIVRIAGQGNGRPLGLVLPPGDTVSYPTKVFGRIADLLVLRLHGEHRPGTAPGPLATSEFIAREIGMRAREIGVNRLVAELPLYGYRWNRNGDVLPITYVEAQTLVVSEAGTFRRDPASQFLTATGRDGWTVWIPDVRTVEAMIAAVRRRGVNQVVLSGAIGSDPEIFNRFPARRDQTDQTIIKSF